MFASAQKVIVENDEMKGNNSKGKRHEYYQKFRYHGFRDIERTSDMRSTTFLLASGSESL